MKAFEKALKGNRLAQKYFIEKFEEAELSREFVRLRIQ